MTIEEMAKELGVSKSTVSRALSGKGRISDSTQKKIIEYAQINGISYRNGFNKKESMRKLVVVIPEDAYMGTTQFFHDCLLGISETASKQGWAVLIVIGNERDASNIKPLLEKESIDGVILLRSSKHDATMEYLLQKNIPVALAGSCEHEQIIQADVDNYCASREIATLLMGFGYKRISFLCGSLDYNVNGERYRGIVDAVRNSSKSDKELFYVGFDRNKVDSILDSVRLNESDCIICADDVICTIVMAKLQAEGYKIPNDIAIVSLYDSINLRCFSPSVTSVVIKTKQWGSSLCQQLISYLSGESYQKKLLVEHEIILRKSTVRSF